MSAICNITIEKDDKFLKLDLGTSRARFLINFFYGETEEVNDERYVENDEILEILNDKQSIYNMLKTELIDLVGYDELNAYLIRNPLDENNILKYYPEYRGEQKVYQAGNYISSYWDLNAAITAYIIEHIVRDGYSVFLDYDL